MGVKETSAEGFSKLIRSIGAKGDNGKPTTSYNSNSLDWKSNKKMPEVFIDLNDISYLRLEAQNNVHISEDIIQILRELRESMLTNLTNRIYVSDRRFVKAIKMLKVAAYTNGRTEVNLLDCILLQYCFEKDYVFNYFLNKLTNEEDMSKFEVIMKRIFSRCCMVLTEAKTDENLEKELENVQNEIKSSLELIISRLTEIFAEIDHHLWLDSGELSSLASIVIPKMENSKNYLQNLLLELEIMKIIITSRKEPQIFVELLGSRWLEFLKTPINLDN